MGMKLLSEYIDSLIDDGVYSFATSQVFESVESSRDSLRKGIRKLRGKKHIATPMRGFHVVVPLEHRSSGCPPAEYFIDAMMNWLSEEYYVCLLSAAEAYGAALQKPQEFQVMVSRARRNTQCHDVRIRYIEKKDISQIPVNLKNTRTGTIRLSSPEVTALDLMGHPGHAAGLSNAATVALDLAEQIDPEKLVHASSLCPLSWSQRLGYVFDSFGEEKLAGYLHDNTSARFKVYTPLRRAASQTNAFRSKKWKVIVNAEVEPEL